MDWKSFIVVFATVFIAELGDKTQIATMLFATNGDVSRINVFIAASTALVATSALGVLAGAFLSGYLSARLLQTLAGVGFIAIGIYTLVAARMS